MNSMFFTYVRLGFDHISDLQAYDHMLFLLALCAIYHPRDWKKLLLLVTAFTLGHSLTLALAAIEIIQVRSDVIEFLIPSTILFTALYNVFFGLRMKEKSKRNIFWNYGFALFFGLIHGIGFSNFFRSLLGHSSEIVYPLFSFNVGVELGQLLIVGGILIISYITMDLLNIKQRDWSVFISGAAAGLSILMLSETAFWM